MIYLLFVHSLFICTSFVHCPYVILSLYVGYSLFVHLLFTTFIHRCIFPPVHLLVSRYIHHFIYPSKDMSIPLWMFFVEMSIYLLFHHYIDTSVVLSACLWKLTLFFLSKYNKIQTLFNLAVFHLNLFVKMKCLAESNLINLAPPKTMRVHRSVEFLSILERRMVKVLWFALWFFDKWALAFSRAK